MRSYLKEKVAAPVYKSEINRSPPTSAEVKKRWIYTSTPPYVFME
jgi:hypothetical protein